MSLPYVILALVTLQRLAELAVAARNTRRLKAAGAVEVGAGHYPAVVALHAAWLAALWAEAGGRAVDPRLIGVFVLLQAARLWVLATLGPRWTTRVIVLPGAPLVARGPFRFVRHPNYIVVAAEIVVLPLAFGLVGTALVFSVLNAFMLRVRLRVEHRTLYGRHALPG